MHHLRSLLLCHWYRIGPLRRLDVRGYRKRGFGVACGVASERLPTWGPPFGMVKRGAQQDARDMA